MNDNPGEVVHEVRVPTIITAALAGTINAREAQRLMFPPTDRVIHAVLCHVCARYVDVSALGILDDEQLDHVIAPLQAGWGRNFDRHAKCLHA